MEIETWQIEEMVRRQSHRLSKNDDIYFTIFIGRNFHLYRFVEKGVGYRGNNYEEDGYILVFSDIVEYQEDMIMPSFVSLYPKKEDGE